MFGIRSAVTLPAPHPRLTPGEPLMKSVHAALFLLAGLIVLGARASEQAPRKSPREALKAFNNLIGSWRGTGEPEGSRAEKQSGFWTETITWGWQFKGEDAWLRLAFDKGKHFRAGELRYVPETDRFRLSVVTPANETLTFEGALADKRLTLERQDARTN